MITGQYGSGIAFSQGVEKGSLAEVDNTTTTLLMLLYSLLFAARWWFPEDASLRQDQAFSLFWHFCSPVHIYSLPLIMLHMQCRSLLASTLDEYSRLLCSPFSPFFLLSGCCNQMVESRSQMPPLMPATTRRPLTTRSSQEAPRQEALPF